MPTNGKPVFASGRERAPGEAVRGDQRFMSEPVQIVSFYVPASAAEPMEVGVPHSGLRMVLVNRESIRLLNDEWRRLGVYFLLGPNADDPHRFRAYVGEVGRSTLLQRVKQHAMTKDWWSRALLVASASDDFNSAEIGWLEGRLYDVLHNAVACDVMNGNRPGDDSLSTKERVLLEKYVEPIMATLRACGAPPDTADQKPPPKGKQRYGETLADLISGGLLKPGTLLQPLKKGLATQAKVLPDGQLEVAGQVYGSLSAAAKAVSGAVAEAGWDFWGAPSGDGGFVPLAKLRERLRDAPITWKFEASIGNGLDGYYSVEGDGERVVWRFGRGEDIEEHELTPVPEDWVTFWDALDRAGIWQWDARYETEGVVDGTYWHLVAEHDGRRVESSGANGYPGSPGADPGRAFTTFCRAVSRLSGREFA